MGEWINAILFGVALVAFTLGMSSIAMGFMSNKEGTALMQERVELGYLGVSALVVCFLMLYVLL